MAFPAPAQSPFGFGAANAAAAAPAFGAAPAAPGFGTVNSTPAAFTFGPGAAAAPAATPAFGAAFGAAAQPAKPLFGTPTPAPAPAGNVFGFQAAPAAASGPSLFGGASAPAFGAAASAPSLFGGAAAPAFGASPGTAGAGGGLFGAAPAATNIFGQQPQQQQQQQQQVGLFGAAGQPTLPSLVDSSGLTQDDAVRSLTRLAAAYTPTSPDYRFQALLSSVVERPEQQVKPAGVDENRWRAALAAVKGPGNAQKLWPVVANGFRDLNTRSRMQAEAVSQNAVRLRELQDRAFAMSRRAAGEFRARVSSLQRQHTDLSHTLLHVMRCVDGLESRLALSAGYNAQQSRQQVAELSRQLSRAEEAVAPVAAGAGLQRRLEAVAAAARMRAGSADGSGGALASVKLDGRSQEALFGVLRDHAEAVRQLQAVLKADELDVEVLKRLTGPGAGGPGGGAAGGELASAMMVL